VQRRIEHEPRRNQVTDVYSDHTKMRAVFEPPSQVSLRTGSRRMAMWVNEHGSYRPVELSGQIEVDRKLPPGWR
jgi:UDP-glucose 4-epimerase